MPVPFRTTWTTTVHQTNQLLYILCPLLAVLKSHNRIKEGYYKTPKLTIQEEVSVITM